MLNGESLQALRTLRRLWEIEMTDEDSLSYQANSDMYNESVRLKSELKRIFPTPQSYERANEIALSHFLDYKEISTNDGFIYERRVYDVG